MLEMLATQLRYTASVVLGPLARVVDALLATQRLDSLASHLSLLVILLTVVVVYRMHVLFPAIILLAH